MSIFNLKRYSELKKKKKRGERKHSALHTPDFLGIKTTSMSFSNNTTSFQKQTQVNED